MYMYYSTLEKYHYQSFVEVNFNSAVTENARRKAMPHCVARPILFHECTSLTLSSSRRFHPTRQLRITAHLRVKFDFCSDLSTFLKKILPKLR